MWHEQRRDEHHENVIAEQRGQEHAGNAQVRQHNCLHHHQHETDAQHILRYPCPSCMTVEQPGEH